MKCKLLGARCVMILRFDLTTDHTTGEVGIVDIYVVVRRIGQDVHEKRVVRDRHTALSITTCRRGLGRHRYLWAGWNRAASASRRGRCCSALGSGTVTTQPTATHHQKGKGDQNGYGTKSGKTNIRPHKNLSFLLRKGRTPL